MRDWRDYSTRTGDRMRERIRDPNRVREPVKPAHIPDDEWAQILLERAERDANKDGKLALSIARMRAIGVDDGRGFCKWCSALLIDDVQSTPEKRVKLHPANDCEGPPRVDDTPTPVSAKPAPAKPVEMREVRQVKLFGMDD